MSTIYSEENPPRRHLHTRVMLALRQHENVGRAIQIAKENMARQAAQLILDEKDVFWEQSKTIAGFTTLEYGIDVFVLTPEELRQIKQDSFKKGFEHASGFMSFNERK
jgi:hypothetical protein